MQNRAVLMNKTNPDCIVSIHQNSYTEEAIDGAQVFYYTSSHTGKTLASLIQQSLIKLSDPSNHRVEKSNISYYLLKQANSPIVIVECGFLSNQKECKKLMDDTYQQQLAWAIHIGILQYLNGVSIQFTYFKITSQISSFSQPSLHEAIPARPYSFRSFAFSSMDASSSNQT